MAEMIFKGCADYQSLSEYTSQYLLDVIRAKPTATICLATGGSPALAYSLFVEQVKRQQLDVSHVTFVKLDEWAGVPLNAPGTCETFLRQHLLTPLGIDENHYISFDTEGSAEHACEQVTHQIRQRGGLDLCLLGLGKNGHLGLNEPAPSLEPFTHVAQLDERTQGHAMLKALSAPVTQGVTLGLKEILAAKAILFLVTGEGKQQAFSEFLTRKVSTQLPASFLWLHQHATCLYDESVC